MQINAHINDDCVCIHAYTCVHVTDEQADHRQVIICSELFPVEVYDATRIGEGERREKNS